MQVTAQLEKVEAERLKIVDGLDGWIAVFAENGSFPEGMRLDSLIRPKDVVCRDHNIAGVIVPVFEELTFEEISYDVADYPLWVGGLLVAEVNADDADVFPRLGDLDLFKQVHALRGGAQLPLEQLDLRAQRLDQCEGPEGPAQAVSTLSADAAAEKAAAPVGRDAGDGAA